MRIFVMIVALWPAFALAAEPADIALLTARKQAVIDAYNKGDIDAMTANYTPDAWHVSPRRPPAIGRAAIAAYFGPAMKLYTMESKATVLDADISGDTATLITGNVLTGAPRAGESAPPFTEHRTNLTVFKKQADGRWLIHRFFDTSPPEQPR